MPWIIAGASLVGGLIQGNAASDAGSQAAGASNAATEAQTQMFNTTNAQSAPWRQAGQTALNAINFGEGFGVPSNQSQTQSGGSWSAPQQTWANAGGEAGTQLVNTPSQWIPSAGNQVTTPMGGYGGLNSGQFTHSFNAGDLNSNLAPNYAWQLGQGEGALQNSQTVSSGLVGGNTLKAINDYAQNYAGNAFQNAFNNYQGQQTNIFNRLSTIAGLGSASANNSAMVGAQTGQGVANSLISGGAAQAAGTVGAAGAYGGALNNAAGSWYGSNLAQTGQNNAVANLTMNPNVSTDYFNGVGAAPY